MTAIVFELIEAKLFKLPPQSMARDAQDFGSANNAAPGQTKCQTNGVEFDCT